MKVIVIIPAAGLGTRMGGAPKAPATSKQFAEIGGVPILLHTLRKFGGLPQVDTIYIALRSSEAEAFQSRLKQEPFARKVRVVEGGEHRQESVANALRTVQAEDNAVVLIHDAVRPFVDSEIIRSVIAAVEKYGAAIAGMPAIDTIKRVERTSDGAIIKATIPREQIVQAQTPQGFRLGRLRQMFAEAEQDGFQGTDEASLLERAGDEVHVVMGSPRNIKITTPSDLALAELYFAQENAVKR